MPDLYPICKNNRELMYDKDGFIYVEERSEKSFGWLFSYDQISYTRNGGGSWGLTSISPIADTIRALSIDPVTNVLWMGQAGNTNNTQGVWSSIDGVNWTGRTLSNKTIYCIGFRGNEIYVGGGAGTTSIYRTIDSGATWDNTGSPSATIYDFANYGTTLYAATSDGLYRSEVSGNTWTKIFKYATDQSLCVTVNQNTGRIWVGQSSRVISYSDNSGGSWTNVSLAGSTGPYDLFIDGDKTWAYMGSNAGMYYTNDGNTWYASNNGLQLSILAEISGTYIRKYNGLLYVMVKNGLYQSIDGSYWAKSFNYPSGYSGYYSYIKFP